VTDGSGRVARQLQRRRRRELYGGVFVAVLGAVVLVVAIIALSHPRQRATVAGSATRTIITTVTPSASSSPAPSQSPSSSPTVPASSGSSSSAGKQPLVVLNNTTVTGLAGKAAARFEAGGWTVTSYGNYQNTILSTCAYYDPAVPGAQAAALALQQQFPAIKRVVAKFAGLPAGPIVVVLTDDYS
jgi:hypothetical protein